MGYLGPRGVVSYLSSDVSSEVFLSYGLSRLKGRKGPHQECRALWAKRELVTKGVVSVALDTIAMS